MDLIIFKRLVKRDININISLPPASIVTYSPTGDLRENTFMIHLSEMNQRNTVTNITDLLVETPAQHCSKCSDVALRGKKNKKKKIKKFL